MTAPTNVTPSPAMLALCVEALRAAYRNGWAHSLSGDVAYAEAEAERLLSRLGERPDLDPAGGEASRQEPDERFCGLLDRYRASLVDNDWELRDECRSDLERYVAWLGAERDEAVAIARREQDRRSARAHPAPIAENVRELDHALVNARTLLQKAQEDRDDYWHLLHRIEPHIDAIVCYASTAGEYAPNQLAVDLRAVLARSPTPYAHPAPAAEPESPYELLRNPIP